MNKVDKERVPQKVTEMREYAKFAKQKRMDQNQFNMDMFHGRQDYSYKKPGQSTEFIPKMSTAVHKLVNFLMQGLIDSGKWFSAEPEAGVTPGIIDGHVVEQVLLRQLKKANYYTHLQDALQTGALQSLMITKVGGKMVVKPSFRTEDTFTEEGERKVVLIKESRDVWQLDFGLVRPFAWFPDPTGDGLFNIEDIEIDKQTLLKIAKDNPDVYNVSVIKKLQDSQSFDNEAKLANETDQNTYQDLSFRRRIKVTEFWGTLLDDDGDILMEDCVCAVADDRFLIMDPRPIEHWHGKDPYIVSPIMRVAQSVWHVALMDTAADLNKALNEVFNLQLDAGLMSVHGIKQLRVDYLEDPTQIDDGILPATTLLLSQAAPPGMKALEMITTGQVPGDSEAMYNRVEKELNSSAFENAYSLGSLPDRQVKATELVAANQAQAGVFSGIVKSIEQEYITPTLEKAWLLCAQMMNDMDSDELVSVLGPEKADRLAAMTPEERFAETAQGFKFKVYGMSATLNKINDFRKNTQLLQTISASPDLMGAFSQKFDMGKFLDELIKSLDIDTAKIAATPQTQPMGNAPGSPTAETAEAAPDASKIPQMTSLPMDRGVEPPMAQMNSGGMTTQGAGQ